MSDGSEKGGDKPATIPAGGDFTTAIITRFIAGVFTERANESLRDHIRRIWIGAIGGVFYACLKNVSGAKVGIVTLWTMDPGIARTDLLGGYLVAGLMSCSTGGAAAWLSAQKSGRLLFLIGMLGVQIFVSLIPGLQSKTGWNLQNPLAPSVAYAADDNNGQECVGDTGFAKGFKAFFGVRDTYDKYAVVVASAKSKDDASVKLKKINSENPDLDLRVGQRACDNQYYPVFATDFLPLKDAKSKLDYIRKQGIPDAYLTPGPLTGASQ